MQCYPEKNYAAPTSMMKTKQLSAYLEPASKTILEGLLTGQMQSTLVSLDLRHTTIDKMTKKYALMSVVTEQYDKLSSLSNEPPPKKKKQKKKKNKKKKPFGEYSHACHLVCAQCQAVAPIIT